MSNDRECPDCSLDRRGFFRAGAVAVAAGSLPLAAIPKAVAAAPTKKSVAETAVKALYDTLTPAQKKVVCFGWDHVSKDRGLLRTHVANNWQITPPTIGSDFFTKKQQGIAFDIFKGLVNPDWLDRFVKQMKDDSGGKPWGATQSIAIFGEPGADRFEYVMTGRHQTIRADGNTEAGVAFGGPIFYGHAPHDEEEPTHPGNVFWPQAVAANELFGVLDPAQRKAALVAKTPREQAVAFRGKKIDDAPGLAVKGMSRDQKEKLQAILKTMFEMYRVEDQEEALACLKAQGGLDACRLAYFSDADIGNDKVWDNWRIEGPSFVWHYRGSPHVHVWVNLAETPDHVLNAK